MRLQSLSLEQFRSYDRLQMSLPEAAVQLFVGSNGSGKTNILESLAVLSLTKSFLPVEEEDLRRWGTEFFRVTAAARTDAGEDIELEVVSQITPRRQKACFVNGVRVTQSAMVGRLPIVVFLPQDLSLFTGAPADRRRFLDQILCQVSPEYFAYLSEYQKLLKQRNALLRAIADGRGKRADLAPWDTQLADTGARVTLLRLELMETFGLTLAEEVAALGEEWTDVRIAYRRSGAARDHTALRAEFEEALAAGLDRDLLTLTTSVGPHRDDWEILVEGRPLQAFASRGQQRVAVLALLFLEASYLELRRGEKPLVLLDDIFSELDDHHRLRIMNAFSDHQVFMTSTHLPPAGELPAAAIWRVQSGDVARD